MYVCICNAVTEGQIKASLDAGAATLEGVARACRAGSDCGACRTAIEEMIEEHAGCGAAPHELPRVRGRAA
jgi:bacterioferritin-associated ferredoxin